MQLDGGHVYDRAVLIDEGTLLVLASGFSGRETFLVVTAFSPFYPLVTNSLSTTSDFCLSPLFIGRDKNGTKPENKISKNTFEPIKSLRHIVLSGAKFLQTSAMKTCFQIAECS